MYNNLIKIYIMKNKGKTFCIGDIHGGYKAFLQCLERSGFNKEEDTLICLGDVADGWSQVPQVFDELLTINNLIYILGNHDLWLLDWFNTGQQPHIWTSQGGKATIHAYEKLKNMMEFDRIESHHKLLRDAQYYYRDDDNRVFVHGGFSWSIPLEDNYREDICWDRKMYFTALYWEFQHRVRNKELITFKDYNEIFVGHTTTNYSTNHKFNNLVPSDKPVHASNLWNLDTGAGYEGKLTIMNVDTKEYWQSDFVKDLYPNEKGR